LDRERRDWRAVVVVVAVVVADTMMAAWAVEEEMVGAEYRAARPDKMPRTVLRAWESAGGIPADGGAVRAETRRKAKSGSVLRVHLQAVGQMDRSRAGGEHFDDACCLGRKPALRPGH